MTLTSSQMFVLQNAATANGNGTPAMVDSYGAAQQVEIVETAGGTCTVALQGTFDGANWIAGVGYQQVDAVDAPARATGLISVGANSRHVYQVLDPYQQVRAVVASVAGGATVTVRLYATGSF